MRIICGKLKGRRLYSVHGMTTRPTSDRVKEAIFNILPTDFNGKEVLDLFAGVGNLGIEALSRGATKAAFVENNHKAISVLKRNIENCGFMESCQIMANTVVKGIRALEKAGNRFDFVFIDPPYARHMVRDSLIRVSRSGILKDDTLIIAEHSVSESVEGRIENLILKDQRKYGKTLISFLVPESIIRPQGREA